MRFDLKQRFMSSELTISLRAERESRQGHDNHNTGNLARYRSHFANTRHVRVISRRNPSQT